MPDSPETPDRWSPWQQIQNTAELEQLLEFTVRTVADVGAAGLDASDIAHQVATCNTKSVNVLIAKALAEAGTGSPSA